MIKRRSRGHFTANPFILFIPLAHGVMKRKSCKIQLNRFDFHDRGQPFKS